MRDGGATSEEMGEVPPPRLFCKKSLDLLDSKAVDVFGSDRESARVWE